MTQVHKGKWAPGASGGCINNPTWRDNPQFFLDIKQQTTVTLVLEQLKDDHFFGIGLYIAKSDGSGKRQLTLTRKDLVTKSDFEDSKTVTLSVILHPLEAPYVVLPCTFYPDEHCKFVLTVSGDNPFTLTPVENDWIKNVYQGHWIGSQAGGCRNHPTNLDNPQYLLTLNKRTHLKLLLLQPKKNFDQIGLYIIKTEGSVQTKLVNVEYEDIVGKTDFSSPKEASLEITLNGGQGAKEAHYVLIPCTFDPGFESQFDLKIFSDNPITLRELKPQKSLQIEGAWTKETAGGCVNHLSWRTNPQYFLSLRPDASPSPRRLTIRLMQHQKERHSIGFYVVRGNGHRRLVLESADIIAKGTFQNSRDVSCEVELKASDPPVVIIPCTFNPGAESKYTLAIFAHPVVGHGHPSDDPEDPATFLRFEPCLEHWHSINVTSAWKGASAGGCRNHTTWVHNPQFILKEAEEGKASGDWHAFILLSQDKKNSQSIGTYVVKTQQSKRLEKMKKKEVVAKAAFRNDREVEAELRGEAGASYCIIPCTFEPGREREFTITIFADRPVKLVHMLETDG